MDLDDFNAVLRRLDVDLWTLIDTAISVAARDHGNELRFRRDGIVEQLYAPAAPWYRDDGHGGSSTAKAGEKERIHSRGAEEKGKLPNEERTRRGSPSMTPSPDIEEDDEEEADEEEEGEAGAEEEDDRNRMLHGSPVEDEESRILAIKEHLDDPDQQSEDSLIQMLQTLADMDIQFKALKATDIGRQVNGLRKHSSAEVRRLVKHLVRKWKDMVDDWVKKSSLETAYPSVINEGDHPEQVQAKISQNKNQIPDFGLSPNIHGAQQASDADGSWSSHKGNREAAAKAEPAAGPSRREAPTPPTPPHPAKEQKESLADAERLASARRRLHENYQEAQNAKKQRTIQVMDIHDIPRPRNSFFRGNAPAKRKG